ncbi:MAG: hypothetical protein KDK27_11590 [Leptospiraceae bacterium]|nr:hypothetical protein [Leptospiraceae bacterium]
MAFWQKIVKKIRRKRKSDAESRGPDLDAQLSELLRTLRSKLQKFLITRSANGVIKKSGAFTLTKTNPGLFRLDAENLSVLINTESFLVRGNDNRVQGLLRVSETALCRALQNGKNVREIVQATDAPERPASLEIYQELIEQPSDSSLDRLPGLHELLEWAVFDLDQMITRNSVNTLAHVLVHASPALEERLRSRLSVRLKATIYQELESLGSPGSNPELNPHSRRLGFLQFETALKEFRTQMLQYRQIEQSRKRLPDAVRSIKGD